MIFRRTERASWPERLWFVRHGESAGNVARDAAEAAGHPPIEIAERGMACVFDERLHEREFGILDGLGVQHANRMVDHALDDQPTVVPRQGRDVCLS